ncbi:hypothetical protein, RMQ11768 [Methylorubrum extorquens AM1]|uniref:Uncharacterized protein n=3 Tax=Methylorubrum extorquens TaxID=408 RepID=C5B0W3_METEA|nr:hypothetical protein, RMQ11768 [Methylorubrum extorquens AM1]
MPSGRRPAAVASARCPIAEPVSTASRRVLEPRTIVIDRGELSRLRRVEGHPLPRTGHLMRLTTIALALIVSLPAAAMAQAGADAQPSPPSPKASATGSQPVPGPSTAGAPVGTPNKPAVVGGTPGAVIGGTPTSGPPGTGGTAGGPALSGR